MNSGRVLRTLAAPHPAPRGLTPILRSDGYSVSPSHTVPMVSWSREAQIKSPLTDPAQQLLPIQKGSPDTSWSDRYLGP